MPPALYLSSNLLQPIQAKCDIPLVLCEVFVGLTEYLGPKGRGNGIKNLLHVVALARNFEKTLGGSAPPKKKRQRSHEDIGRGEVH